MAATLKRIRHGLSVLTGRRDPPNSSRVYMEAFVQQAAASLGRDMVMLDAGAGNGLYRKWFSHCRYESADFCQVDKRYDAVTYVCDLGAIPVERDRYDLVLITQVIEHLAEPRDVLREMHRVLKPGGLMFLSGPLYYEEHEQPHDYYRYTQFGMRHLLTTSGFDIDSLQWLEGYCGVVCHQLLLAARALPRSRRDCGGGMTGLVIAAILLVARPCLRLLAAILSKADRLRPYRDGGHCKNYIVVARKPAAPGV